MGAGGRLLQTKAEGKDVVVYLLILCTVVLATGLFVTAFFPAKGGVEEWNSSEETHPSVPVPTGNERIIFMLIDAMRADFIYANESRFRFISRKIQAGGARAFVTKAHPPTVTLPRLKAMIGGSIPGFLDVVSNLNSPELEEDNVITRAVAAGKNVTMFGDETWLRLFPNSFLRSDGTTAFFVLDTEIVDSNVTRHVMPELQRQDWDLMILHYLGLDHAGHLGGVHTEQMAEKQLEMDALVQDIHSELAAQARAAEQDSAAGLRPTMLVVCSDHGMTDQGNHAGASDAERDAVAVFFSDMAKGGAEAVAPAPRRMRRGGGDDDEEEGDEEEGLGGAFPTVWQVDLAPTLALLLGLEVPTPSIGRAMPGALDHLSASAYLDALQRNARQLRRRLGRERGEALGAEWEAAMAGARACEAQLQKGGGQERMYSVRGAGAGAAGCVVEAERGLEVFFEAACSALEAEQGAVYDVPLLLLALALMTAAVAASMVQCLHAALPLDAGSGGGKEEEESGAWCSGGRIVGWGAAGGALSAAAWAVGCGGGVGVGGGQGKCGVLGLGLVAGGALGSGCVAAGVSGGRAAWRRLRGVTQGALRREKSEGGGAGVRLEVAVALGGGALQLASLGGSSLVEEEQETFYFLSTTLCACVLRCALASADAPQPLRSPATLAAGVVMAVLRVGRAWNQSGVKHAGRADIAAWLKQEAHAPALYLLSLASLAALAAAARELGLRLCSGGGGWGRQAYGWGVPGLVVGWHAVRWHAGDDCWAARGMYAAGLAVAAHATVRLCGKTEEAAGGEGRLLAWAARSWIALLLILLPLSPPTPAPALAPASSHPCRAARSESASRGRGGGADAAAAQAPHAQLPAAGAAEPAAGRPLPPPPPQLVALFTCLIAVSGPLLAFLAALAALALATPPAPPASLPRPVSGAVLLAVSLFSFLRVCCLGFFCAVAFAMREHLFVWSVFAPKLLCECALSATLLAVHTLALLLAFAADAARGASGPPP